MARPTMFLVQKRISNSWRGLFEIIPARNRLERIRLAGERNWLGSAWSETASFAEGA